MLLRWRIFSEMHPSGQPLAAPREMKLTVDVWLHHAGGQGVSPAICLSALLIFLINQRIQTDFMVTSCQFISISCQRWREKEIRNKSQGQSFAATKAKLLNESAQWQRFAAQSCKPQGHSFAAQSCKPQGQRFAAQSYKPQRQSFAEQICKPQGSKFSNKTVACHVWTRTKLWLATLHCKVLPLWLATLCCKALPLWSFVF